MNPRQNRSVTWLQNESSSKLFIEALSTDRNHKSSSHTRICRSHCWYKFRFRLEGNFSSEWFLLRWPSVSLLSYFFNACSQLYVLPVCACCCSSVCSVLPVRHVTCALYELTTAARQLARTLLWLWTSNGLTEWNNIFIRPSEIVERDTCGASWWLLRLYFWITAQTNEPKLNKASASDLWHFKDFINDLVLAFKPLNHEHLSSYHTVCVFTFLQSLYDIF